MKGKEKHGDFEIKIRLCLLSELTERNIIILSLNFSVELNPFQGPNLESTLS